MLNSKFKILFSKFSIRYSNPTPLRRRKGLLISLTVLVFIMIPVVFFTLKNARSSIAAWFDEAWGYRQRVDITNSGSAQTDFQVAITLNTSTLISAGKMQSNCNDIRVTDINGKVLPYWIETGTNACNAATTAIWTKVPSISATGTTIYLYYGNPSAISAQNGNKVFEFFDDFSGNAIDSTKWTQGTIASTSGTNFSQSGGNLIGGNNNRYVQSINTFTGNYITESRNCETSTANNGWSSVGFYKSGSDSYGVLVHNGQAYFRNDTTWPGGSSFTANQCSRSKAKVVGTAATASIVGETSGSQSDSSTNSGISSEYIRLSARYDNSVFDQNYSATWDWVLVRKAVTTEPSVASPTNEEKSLAPIAYWKFDEGYGNNTRDESSNQKNGTLSGAPDWKPEAECISGKCLFYDGTSNDYVSISDSGTNDPLDLGTKSFSVSFWGKPIDYTYPKSLFPILDGNGPYISGSGHEGWSLGDGYVSTGEGIVINDGTNMVNSTLTFNVGSRPPDLVNKWTHFVYVFDRTSTNRVYLYINGVLQTSTVDISTVTGSISNTSALLIGFGTGWKTQGYIDDFKIYSYARSASQIKSDYASKGGGSVKGSSVQEGTNVKSNDAFSNGLVGYWKTDENTGTSTADSSGNGNMAYLGGSVNPTWISGKYGAGLSFSGSNDYIQTGDSASLQPQNITVSAWVNYSTADGSGFIVHYNGHGSNAWSYHMDIASGNKLQVYFQNGSGNSMNVLSTNTVPANTWSHVAFTYDGSRVVMYINGIQDPSTSDYTGGITYDATSWTRIGRGDYEFNGSLDEVRTYNRALSPKEISDLYNWAPGPTVYYDFDAHTGNSIIDKSGNNINGSILSAPITSWVSGKYGSAIFFNPIDYYGGVTVPQDNKWVFGLNDFTVETWIYRNSNNGNDNYVIGNYPHSGVNGVFTLELTNTSPATLGFLSRDSSGSYVNRGNLGTLSDRTWNHITLTRTNQTTIKVYVNGILSTSTTTGNSGNYDWSGGGSVFLLGYGNGGNCITGKFDEFKIYNYARTPGQIVEDMNAGHPAPGSPVGSAVGYWKFDEGHGTAAKDSAGLNPDFSFAGTTAWSNNCKFGKCLNLVADDTDYAYFTVPSSSPFNLGSSDFTVSNWQKVPQPTTYGSGILGRYPHNTSYNGNWVTGIQDDRTSYFFGHRNTSGDIAFWQTIDYTPYFDKWTYTSWVKSGSKMYLYINGQLNTSWDITTPFDITFSGVPFYIGQTGWSPGVMNGLMIDEFKLYNSALTADQIKLDYNHGSAMVLGSTSTTSTGVPDNSSTAEYCVPGSSDSCSAPVAEWKMDEGTGTATQDVSGNNNTGTLSGATWTIGKFGKAINFKNSNDEVTVNHNGVLSFTNAMTFSGWIYPTVLSGNQQILLKPGANWNGYQFVLWGSLGNLDLRARFGDCNNATVDHFFNTGGIPLNTWTHLTFTYDAAAGTNNMKLYKNGILISQGTESGNICATADPLYFTAASEQFYGKQDNYRLYNYARTPAQIAWDYNRGGPIGWWKFDECQGGTANDSSENGRTGTITIGGTAPQTSAGTCSTSGTAWGNGATGRYNSSLSLDGADDYVQAGSNPITGTSPFSLSAWLKVGSHTTFGLALYIGDAAAGQSAWIGWTAAAGQGSSNSIGGGFYGSNYGSGVTDNNWHHVVLTFAGGAGGSSKLYVDGVQKVSTTETPNLSSASIMMGKANSGTAYWYNGLIDDARVYNYALTPTQISTIYNNGAVNYGPATGSP